MQPTTVQELTLRSGDVLYQTVRDAATGGSYTLRAEILENLELRSDDNQLHLRLQGTGAVIESGQVRELDIEVPVPGAWVGHRRVTLQLRLTLTPDTEDEDGGNSPS